MDRGGGGQPSTQSLSLIIFLILTVWGEEGEGLYGKGGRN